MTALAADTVLVRRARLRGMTAPALRRQLASVAVPRTERFVFIRRLAIRAPAAGVGAALGAALAAVAGARSDAGEAIAFDDFPAMAAALARDALAGAVEGAWHWRQLDLPPAAGVDVVAALLVRFPAQANATVAALARASLLRAVWRGMSEAAMERLAEAVVAVAGISLPRSQPGRPEGALPEGLVARAVALWGPVLEGLPPAHPAVRLAAVLALLRWAPGLALALKADGAAWSPVLLDQIVAPQRRVAEDRYAEPMPTEPVPRPGAPPRATDPGVRPDGGAGLPSDGPAIAPAAVDGGIEPVATEWAGVLFLINALSRLGIEARLADAGTDGPSGWRVILSVAARLGLPEQDGLYEFLLGADPETVMPAGWADALVAALVALYGPLGAWPMPLRQPGVLFATASHLDLHLATASPDPAARLAALDVDPGWVPWLGRVVAFHYDAVPVRMIGPA